MAQKKNGVRTSAKLAKTASQMLRKPETPSKVKSLSGSALVNRKVKSR